MNKKKIYLGASLFFLCLCFAFNFGDSPSWAWTDMIIVPIMSGVTSLALLVMSILPGNKSA